MDKFNSLRALTGEDGAPEDSTTPVKWSHNVRVRHIYEGTDSEGEEDEDISPSQRVGIQPPLSRDRVETGSSKSYLQLFILFVRIP